MKVLTTAILLCACSASDDVPSPQVSSVVPDHASAGALVMISGSYFCQRPGSGSNEDPTCVATGTVHFGTAPGTPTIWSDTSITVEVPQTAPGALAVSVTAAGRTSNTATFTAE